MNFEGGEQSIIIHAYASGLRIFFARLRLLERRTVSCLFLVGKIFPPTLLFKFIYLFLFAFVMCRQLNIHEVIAGLNLAAYQHTCTH